MDRLQKQACAGPGGGGDSAKQMNGMETTGGDIATIWVRTTESGDGRIQ